MASQTGEIVRQSLDVLLDNSDFLPDLKGAARSQAFASLASILSTPNRMHKAFLRIPLDNGKVVRIPAYRIQHNDTLGPYKGGIRFHESVNEEEVINLAALMTLKNALHEVPFGGGKGGVAVNPREFSMRELNLICKKYVQYFGDILGPDKDIPAPDMGTSEREMDWMMSEYKNIHPGTPYLGSFTGKSVINGGSLGRREATGKGVYYTLRYLLHDFVKGRKDGSAAGGKPFANTVFAQAEQPLAIAIQGFGNVGSAAALEAYRCTYLHNKIVAVSDRNVTLYNSDGLDVPGLAQFCASHRGDLPVNEEQLAEAKVKAEILDREAIIGVEANVLILAALENQVRRDNASQVKARIIVEGANAPISGEADESLSREGVVIVPDILANAGGVIVSYFEWLQGRETQYYSEEEVFRQLFEKMKGTLDSVLPSYFESGLTLRQSCYAHSVKKLSTMLYRHGKLF